MEVNPEIDVAIPEPVSTVSQGKEGWEVNGAAEVLRSEALTSPETTMVCANEETAKAVEAIAAPRVRRRGSEEMSERDMPQPYRNPAWFAYRPKGGAPPHPTG
ncbi:MAG: hypothetical protein SynsKO_08940 [Synoicihabitans sp.]